MEAVKFRKFKVSSGGGFNWWKFGLGALAILALVGLAMWVQKYFQKKGKNEKQGKLNLGEKR